VNVWLPLNVTDLVIWVDLENTGDLLLITEAVIVLDLVILVVLRNTPDSLQHREIVIVCVAVGSNTRDSVNTADELNLEVALIGLQQRHGASTVLSH
jgi:hypothetical protein